VRAFKERNRLRSPLTHATGSLAFSFQRLPDVEVLAFAAGVPQPAPGS
jgi:hypothetical protein